MAPSKNSPQLIPDPQICEFQFGSFSLYADGTLKKGDTPIHLPPKELAALRVLLRNAGQVVSCAQLKHDLWGDVHVTADSVPRCLSSLRARLEPDHFIQTLYKRGYRFVGEVTRSGARTPSAIRIAVMPFSAGQGVDEHLGPAVAEEVTTLLTQMEQSGLSILARDSVFTLARQGCTAVQIGQTLRADLVLSGTLRGSPSYFRLRVEMIRVEDGTQIWVEDMLVTRDRIATLKDELIVRLAVRLRLGIPRRPAGQTVHVGKADAYESFLRGHHEWQTLERHRMIDGMESLLLATEIDPSLLAARIDLAHVIVAQELCGFMPPRVAAERMRSLAHGLQDLAETAPALLPPLGWMAFHVDRDPAAALDMFSQSAQLPHDTWTTRLRAMFALSMHAFDEAEECLESALLIDPFAPGLHAHLAWTWHLAGNPQRAAEQIEEAIRLFPDDEHTRFYGSMVLASQGDVARAEKLADALVRQSPHCDQALAVHAYALARDRREKESRELLERLQWLGRERYMSSSFLPAVWVALGEIDEALAALHVANEARCPWIFQMVADPRISALRGHPEFEHLRLQLEENDGANHRIPELQA